MELAILEADGFALGTRVDVVGIGVEGRGLFESGISGVAFQLFLQVWFTKLRGAAWLIRWDIDPLRTI